MAAAAAGSKEIHHLPPPQSHAPSRTYDDPLLESTIAPHRTPPKAKGDKEGKRECLRGNERERMHTQHGETTTSCVVVVDNGGG